MKILIIEACLVNFGDDRGGQHQDPYAVIDVTKDTARDLVQAGRALYTDKKDDPSKGGNNTASAEMLKAAKDIVASAAKTVTKAPAEGQ